jgi:hypothetical protein
MPECDYCGASFDSEAAELKHLKSEHRDELGPIDRRRIGDVDSDDDGIPAGPIALGVVLLASAGIVAYVVFIAGGTGGNGNTGPHVHGTMEATIAGEEIDFMQPQFAGQGNRFHFHGSEQAHYGANVWHVHGNGGISLKYALGTLGMEVNDEGTTLSFNGTTYDDSDPDTEVRIQVDGESVEPGGYVLKGIRNESVAAEGKGDDVEIVVETE